MIAYYSSFLFYLVITVFDFYQETHFLPRSKKFMRNYVHLVFLEIPCTLSVTLDYIGTKLGPTSISRFDLQI